MGDQAKAMASSTAAQFLNLLRARTAARILVDRAGAGYRTDTLLSLRQDHAAALDAVHAELALERDFRQDFVRRWSLFAVQTQAASKQEFLLNPPRGRRLNEQAQRVIQDHCMAGADLQIVIGDGLSAAAVVTQVPRLFPLLEAAAGKQGWTVGQPFVVRYCRVGVLNDVGELLKPSVVVLLIGERPGLAAADSLSAYMAFRPSGGHTDAQRNLISNIHGRGVQPEEAARRIIALAQQMRRLETSGVLVKEDLAASLLPASPGKAADEVSKITPATAE